MTLAFKGAFNKMVNERTDIFNFGATMYRMVTGQFPPASLTEAGVVPLKVVSEPPIDDSRLLPGQTAPDYARNYSRKR